MVNPKLSRLLKSKRIERVKVIENDLGHFHAQTSKAKKFLSQYVGLVESTTKEVLANYDKLEKGREVRLSNGISLRKQFTGNYPGKNGGLRLAGNFRGVLFFMRVKSESRFFPIEAIPEAFRVVDKKLQYLKYKVSGVSIRLLQPHILHKQDGLTFRVSAFLDKERFVPATSRILPVAERKKLRTALLKLIASLPEEYSGGISERNVFKDLKTNSYVLIDLEPGDDHISTKLPSPKPRLIRHLIGQ